jgi:nucleoid-associated protein YgaU
VSLVSFIRDAGEKLFNHPAAAAPAAAPAAGPAAAPAPAPAPATAAAPAPDIAALNAQAGEAIQRHVQAQGLQAENLKVQYDGASETVTVSGTAPDQATREKIVLCCGNVSHVAQVKDELGVAQASEPPARFHTVQKGDTLSKIAQQAYGNANAYDRIFQANRPMLSDPNKIYPGQVLRIPQ